MRGLELAVDHQLTDIYNLGTGESYAFNMILDMLNTELGTNIKLKYIEGLISDVIYVHDTMTDPTKMRKATGWEPQISLSEGIQYVCDQYI